MDAYQPVMTHGMPLHRTTVFTLHLIIPELLNRDVRHTSFHHDFKTQTSTAHRSETTYKTHWVISYCVNGDCDVQNTLN